jgi:hypothetical protein
MLPFFVAAFFPFCFVLYLPKPFWLSATLHLELHHWYNTTNAFLLSFHRDLIVIDNWAHILYLLYLIWFTYRYLFYHWQFILSLSICLRPYYTVVHAKITIKFVCTDLISPIYYTHYFTHTYAFHAVFDYET